MEKKSYIKPLTISSEIIAQNILDASVTANGVGLTYKGKASPENILEAEIRRNAYTNIWE